MAANETARSHRFRYSCLPAIDSKLVRTALTAGILITSFDITDDHPIANSFVPKYGSLMNLLVILFDGDKVYWNKLNSRGVK